MKLLMGITLAVAVTLGAASQTLAETIYSVVPGGKQLSGQVSSVDGSTVTLKTTAGDTQSYKVDRNLISKLKLENGSNIVIDGTRLRTGQVKSLDAYTAEVVLDQGDELKTYILTREARRYLTVGDRVVVTPDLKLVRSDLYKLTANDLRLQSVMVASSAQTGSVSTESSRTVISQPVVREPAIGGPAVEVTAPVPGLW
ncbi:MAG: hypothetical protein MH252_19055 [Thermosynechococcaceae cyanobacterium MS004]|nr:hypothetical protein [Thermosynechococcaceae cyanobacterium MS004]